MIRITEEEYIFAKNLREEGRSFREVAQLVGKEFRNGKAPAEETIRRRLLAGAPSAPPQWPEADKIILIAHVKAGRSSSQIARLMPQYTRSAICGKCNRMGLILSGGKN